VFNFIPLRRDWRLSYINLQDEKKQKNLVEQSMMQLLWMPNLAFDNCVKDVIVKVDEMASFTINKLTNGNMSLSKNLEEEERFEGDSNDLVFLRNYDLV